MDCVSVLKLEDTDYEEAVKHYSIEEAKKPEKCEANGTNKEIVSKVKLLNPRKGVSVKAYCKNCREFSDSILSDIRFKKSDRRVLVLGTEECMYPAIMLGKSIEELGNISVFTHSTTRSPIGICDDADYPIKNGYKLHSFYDKDRTTYIYNLQGYDQVIIVTDSKNIPEASKESIISALNMNGNDNILLIKG